MPSNLRLVPRALHDDGIEDLRCVPTLPVATMFARSFVHLDGLYRRFTRDGVLLVALRGDGSADSYLHVPVDVEPAFATIGRHPACDLVLGVDARAPSRHAVLSARRIGLDEARLRLRDLASGLGLETDDGDRHVDLTVDGNLFVRVGCHTLFCLPTGSLAPFAWGRTAAETWASFPEQVLQEARPLAREPARASLPALSDGSLMTCRAKPRGRLRAIAPAPGDGPPVGRILVTTAQESIERVVGVDELRRGVLLGRDDRCTVSVRLKRLSRAHLLIAEDEGAVWAIDTASTNGTTLRDERVRRVRLSAGTVVVLGGQVAVRWQPLRG